MKNTLRIILLLIISTLSAYSQDFPGRTGKVFGRQIKSINPNNNTVRCVSSEYEEYLQEIDEKRAREAEFEAWLAPLVEKQKQNLLTQRNANTTAEIIKKPVVVHVNDSGPAVGIQRNINDARVLSQQAV